MQSNERPDRPRPARTPRLGTGGHGPVAAGSGTGRPASLAARPVLALALALPLAGLLAGCQPGASPGEAAVGGIAAEAAQSGTASGTQSRGINDASPGKPIGRR